MLELPDEDPVVIAMAAFVFRQAAPPATGTVEGYVVVAGSSRPLPGVSVFLPGPPSNRPDPVISSVTDANGHFSFRNVPFSRGPYCRIGAEAVGFDRVIEDVPVQPNQSALDVVLTMMTGGNIRGRITGPGGAPLASTTVFVYREEHVWVDPPRHLAPFRVAADGSGVLESVIVAGTDAYLGQPLLGGTGNFNRGGPTRASVQTDADGYYVLRRLPPARYFVGVEFPVGYTPNPDGLATTFYPGVTDSTQARPIIIEPETDVTAINFSVQKPQRFTVSGRIESLDGAPASAVTLHPRGANRNMAPSWTRLVGPNGQFEIQSVIEGSYELSVNARSKPPDIPVEVRGNTSGIVVQLPITTIVTGTLTAVLKPGDTQIPEPVTLAFEIQGGPLGVQVPVPGPFTITGVAPGTHYLYEMLPPAGYVLDVHQGAHDVADDHLVRAGPGAEPLTVVARRADYAVVQGAVLAGEGKSRLSQVLLVPDGPRRANPMEYYSTRTNFDGTFKLDNVVPGNYKLVAWEAGRILGLDPYMDPATLLPFERYAVNVVVAANSHLMVDASLVPR